MVIYECMVIYLNMIGHLCLIGPGYSSRTVSSINPWYDLFSLHA